jgi:hypothetical protein
MGVLLLKELIMASGFFKFSFSVALVTLSSATWAQIASEAAQCILAGRVDAEQRWAPQARGVELVDAAGKRVSAASKEALASVKSVRLAQPALLSSCNGDQALPEGGAGGPKKGPSPAISKGAELVNVQAVTYPPLRVGGSLVELKLEVPAKRVVMLTR